VPIDVHGEFLAYHTIVPRTRCVTLELSQPLGTIACGMNGPSHVSHIFIQSIEGAMTLSDVCIRVAIYLSPLVFMFS
jgi:hypothetical protein